MSSSGESAEGLDAGWWGRSACPTASTFTVPMGEVIITVSGMSARCKTGACASAGRSAPR